ncbi:unnamed protein product [Allacma fusca]|uniref:Uncharacterized protein n=1 Tax=Allacma fusca TaxID=39272 RepID=A0A8J2PV20_9HEXA|nr:unnamed protein product [Allacma fusca]
MDGMLWIGRDRNPVVSNGLRIARDGKLKPSDCEPNGNVPCKSWLSRLFSYPTFLTSNFPRRESLLRVEADGGKSHNSKTPVINPLFPSHRLLHSTRTIAEEEEKIPMLLI